MDADEDGVIISIQWTTKNKGGLQVFQPLTNFLTGIKWNYFYMHNIVSNTGFLGNLHQLLIWWKRSISATDIIANPIISTSLVSMLTPLVKICCMLHACLQYLTCMFNVTCLLHACCMHVIHVIVVVTCMSHACINVTCMSHACSHVTCMSYACTNVTCMLYACMYNIKFHNEKWHQLNWLSIHY